jgi:magnesium-transporting ATPase (P-type)
LLYYTQILTSGQLDSSLTGESEPQERFPVPEGSKARAVEATNLLFNSTLVVSGEAWGVVVRTGDHTLIGKFKFTSNKNKIGN